jgi:GNAT superfamily N-acetyltransferase
VTEAFRIRAARPEDADVIAEWTENTFDWGDYVAERIQAWIDEPDSTVIVCADDDDDPLGVVHVAMLSATEAWLEGARVHPEHRRSGMGSSMNRAGTDWARDRGGRVARLTTDRSNVAAQRQVEGLGYRHTSSWASAKFELEDREVTGGGRLAPATAADVDAAWLSWSAGELALAGRELLAIGWRWRKALPADLLAAASRGELLQSQSGWVVMERPEPDWARVGWLTTDPDGAPELVSDLLDHASRGGATELWLKVPWVPWITETLVRSGAQPSETLVYSLAL